MLKQDNNDFTPLIVLFKWTVGRGGAEKQLLLLYEGLIAQSYRVMILAARVDMELLREYGAENAVVVTIRFRDMYKVLKEKAKLSNTIIHAWDHKSSVYGYLLKLLLRVSFVDGSIRSAPSTAMKHYRLFMRKYKLFHLLKENIVSNTSAGVTAYKLRKSPNIHVVYNGIKFDPVPLTSNLTFPHKLNVCMVANMRWKKDFATFINAAELVLEQEPDIGFYLIGDGESRSKFENLARKKAHKNNIHFTGSISNPDSYIASMDICVLCNDISGEGFSNSIMEYMLGGKPVIATDMGGNNELVVEGETGYLIKEYGVEELSEKLLRLINNEQLRVRMGLAGRSRLEKLFSVDTMVKAYRDIYDNVCKVKEK